ncbi:MAG: BatA domain-containing protein [Pirellulaceae bacterium]
MSALFWVFLAGTAAVTFPLVLHLIRRTPRGRQQFSSLMFLKASPPRLTRRSRLDNLLLLLLRALAIVLLALAFTRPYWRTAADISIFDAPARRVAILVDTSASMRRGDLWKQAVARVNEVLDELEPADSAALFTFSDRMSQVVGFDERSELEGEQLRELIRGEMARQGPGWSDTDLGAALTTVADSLDVANDLEQTGDTLQIIVVSDMQRGADLDALQAYEWPDTVRVTVRRVELDDASNARVTLLARDASASQDMPTTEAASDEPRVRVTNSSDSSVEQFRVWWSDGGGDVSEDDAVAFYVPPGESRVLAVPRPEGKLDVDRLVLRGDAAVFDNEYYTAPLKQRVVRVVGIGADAAGDAEGLRLYLEEALESTPLRQVQFTWSKPGESLAILQGEQPELIVVTDAISGEQREQLTAYQAGGGVILAVLRTPETVASLGELIGDAEVEDAQSDDAAATGDSTADRRVYAMLAEIDFTHPLFAPLAGARYNDFTRIHFWKHRRVQLSADKSTNVVARFDDGSPAVWERIGEKGKTIVFASGWHPADSELALSTKFVPLLDAVLKQCGDKGLETTTCLVNQPLALPELLDDPTSNEKGEGERDSAPSKEDGQRVVIRPDGGEVKIASDARTFTAVDPGVYTLKSGPAEHAFAVNLAARESVTEPLALESLEQLGVRLGVQPSQSAEADRLRQLRDTELEDRQKIWKWLIVAALGVLGIETCLAGWRARSTSQASGEAS